MMIAARIPLILLALLTALALSTARAEPPAERSAYDFVFPGIDGAPLALESYRGQPLLVVNTASRCGFTGQYAGLQSLWERYRGQGLVVIGAPSQDFRQELDDREAVKAFCEVNFGIDFPMTDIVVVKGPEAHPFYAWAAAATRAPTWNFNKYLIDQEGALVRRYPSSATPERIAVDVERLLAGG